MTLSSIVSLWFTLIVLAVIPGPGVLTVVSRSLAAGFFHGLAVSAGIVCGDYVYIALSLLGLSVLAQSMAGFFHVMQYAGAGYLIWLGISLLRLKEHALNTQNSPPKQLHHPAVRDYKGYIRSFMTGLITTLGNPKAIIFYASFFPAFINMAKFTTQDLLIIVTLVFFTVGGVMAGYAFTANQSRKWFNNPKALKKLHSVAGVIMLASGCWLGLRL